MAMNINAMIAYLANQRAEPVIQRANQISEAAVKAGDEQMTWARGQADQMSGLGTKLVNLGDEATAWGKEQSGILTGQANNAFGRFNSAYVPIELQSAIDSVAGVYADDNTFDTLAHNYASGISDPTQRAQTIATLQAQRGAQKAGAENAAGVAAGDVGKAYAAKNADIQRTLSARGVSADKLAAMSQISGVQQAADTAAASNTARDATLRAGVEDRLKQIGLGRSLLSQGVDLTNAAGNVRTAGLPFYSAGAGAVESASRVRTSPQSWYGLGLQGAQTQLGASQVGIDAMNQGLINNMRQGEIDNQRRAATLGGIGSLVGTGLGMYASMK